ncbi:30S ribosomal protein S12 methylthiotransferase accessory factor YcaO [Marinobacterium sp. xm-d-530]|uniref:30S ribosomal protein S12 methylthiotransferase accessory factor YcaO n=1 Tax=Marinobacterium sp. xm-d-530 TaxID=2497747 RepID=UPI001568A8F4|nr:30S ribosomal protein S12 methylthiotransferase accessory factor YcaO [Marinobacterium sp. xm-d-530]NRQ02789.1 Ribosomal protein S12 methylthiotransferase accessory factor YcaO [Marinobacterium sp. xm-d-530]
MTRIPGKDAPLEESIERMSQGLKDLGFDIEEVSWLNPVPHVWSLHIRDRHCPLLFTNGKGSTPEACLASALGEFYERLSTNYFFADYFFGQDISDREFVHYPNERWFPASAGQWPEGLLDQNSRNHYDPDEELSADMLVDLNSGRADRGVCALPFVRQSDKQTVWFPVNVLENLYVSNGMAAGNNLFEARVQALSEIFERHIKNTIISSGITLPRIPAKVIAQYPRIEASIKALRVQGFLVDVRDASLGGKYPLVNVTLFNRNDGGCFASFGAHPKFEVALERTVTELLQGRALDSLNDFPHPTFDIDEAAEPQNLETHFIDSSGVVAWDMFADEPDYPFTEWNIEGSSEDEFDELCRIIHGVDLQIYIADYQHLGLDCCRILVPGMSEIYPVDELIWRNNNLAAPLRSRLLSPAQLDQEMALDLLEELEQGGFDDQQRLAKLLGVATDSDSPWDRVRIGDIKFKLALKSGELELALEQVDWMLNFGHLTDDEIKLHRCLSELIRLEIDSNREREQYERPLVALYGEALYQEALANIAGEKLFDALSGLDETFSNLNTHHSLLTVYKRLHDVKSGSYEKRY